MHYYATYALARAAGLRADAAREIATCAEYVDHADRVAVVCQDGFEIRAEPTSHHPSGRADYTTPRDQRRTWIPFHFLPGNQGGSLDERLLCAMDSPIARAVLDHALERLDRDLGVPLLGIVAHAYADTFAHYGFSGISSPMNRVDEASFVFHCSAAARAALAARRDRFVARYASGPLAGRLLCLGHGSVATFPDEPYLAWEFDYASPARPSGKRENAKTFLVGCERLHDFFVRARARLDGGYDDPGAYRDFAHMRSTIRAILAVEGDVRERADAWKGAAGAGLLYGQPEPIPDYDAHMLDGEIRAFALQDRERVERTLACRFLQAANLHRGYLLDELLPGNGLNVESVPIDW